MSIARGQHPGLRRIPDARGLRQPPARQAWAEDRLLEPGERGDRGLRPVIRLGFLPMANSHTFAVPGPSRARARSTWPGFMESANAISSGNTFEPADFS